MTRSLGSPRPSQAFRSASSIFLCRTSTCATKASWACAAPASALWAWRVTRSFTAARKRGIVQPWLGLDDDVEDTETPVDVDVDVDVDVVLVLVRRSEYRARAAIAAGCPDVVVVVVVSPAVRWAISSSRSRLGLGLGLGSRSLLLPGSRFPLGFDDEDFVGIVVAVAVVGTRPRPSRA